MLNFFKKQKNKSVGGFTLVETLVALSIFTISILALMVALGGGLKNANFAKSKMTASFLAQEGIELVRGIRDTYVLYDGSENGWAEFLTHMNPCNGKGCILHTEDINYNEPDQPITDILIENCLVLNGCPSLYFHPETGIYDYYNDGDPETSVLTTFSRNILIENISGSGDEIIVRSVVYWGNDQKVDFSENMFDWNK